ncbi:MAG: hypothetical protein AB1798_11410, partial [Spirochaetota bacterium]
YNRGILSKITYLDGNDTILYENRYYQTSSGRLRKIVKAYPDKGIQFSAYIFSGDSLREEWHGTSDSGDLFRFNTSSGLTSLEEWKKNKLYRREEYFKPEDTYAEYSRYSIEMNFITGSVTKRYYGQGDNVLRLITENKGRLVEEILSTYADGKLTARSRRTPGLREEWRYIYSPDGKLVREEYKKNGRMITARVHTGDKSYYEELYRSGAVFLIVYFENDEKIREEFVLKKESTASGVTGVRQ